MPRVNSQNFFQFVLACQFYTGTSLKSCDGLPLLVFSYVTRRELTYHCAINYFLSDEESLDLSDDDFDVSGEHWNEVLEAVKNQNEGQLKSRLQEVDDVRKQRLVSPYVTF